MCKHEKHVFIEQRHPALSWPTHLSSWFAFGSARVGFIVSWRFGRHLLNPHGFSHTTAAGGFFYPAAPPLNTRAGYLRQGDFARVEFRAFRVYALVFVPGGFGLNFALRIGRLFLKKNIVNPMVSTKQFACNIKRWAIISSPEGFGKFCGFGFVSRNTCFAHDLATWFEHNLRLGFFANVCVVAKRGISTRAKGSLWVRWIELVS